MEAKKHHFVPVFYQKGFTDTEGLLWVYDSKLGTRKQLHPISLCWEKELYTVSPKDGRPKNRRIETDVLSPIDGAAATIIRKLSPGVILDRSEIRIFVRFIASQFTRLPSFGKAVRKTVEAWRDEQMRMEFAAEDKAQRALNALGKHTGKPPNVSAALMVNAVTNKRFSARANQSWFIEQMFAQANFLGRRIENSEWTFLVAPQSSAFILSERSSPALSYAQHSQFRRSSGMIYASARLFGGLIDGISPTRRIRAIRVRS